MDSPLTKATGGQDMPDDILPEVEQGSDFSDQPAGVGASAGASSGAVTGGVAQNGAQQGGLQHDDTQQTVPNSRALVAVPDSAGDSDLIEKEWVIKAKQIVEHTAEDPFLQQQELSKIKADYMKKRYNKDIGMV